VVEEIEEDTGNPWLWVSRGMEGEEVERVLG